jgi:hypothetical protein
MRPDPPRDSMSRRIRQNSRRPLAAILGIAGCVVICSGAAKAEDRTLASIVYDLAIERPIGLAETAIGIGVTGVAYPIALGAGKTNLVVERCIAMPGRYTFTRGLGDFSARPESQCSPVGFSLGLVKLSFGLIERPLGLLFGRSPFSGDAQGPQGGVEVDVEVPRQTMPDDAAEI